MVSENKIQNTLQNLLKEELEIKRLISSQQKITLGDLEQELADACGISRRNIISIKRGQTLPSLPVAISIAKYFNKSVDDIFKMEEEDEREIEINFGDIIVTQYNENIYYNLVTYNHYRQVILWNLRDGFEHIACPSLNILSSKFQGDYFNGNVGREKIVKIIPRYDIREELHITLVGEPQRYS